jgi:hypothetical protein
MHSSRVKGAIGYACDELARLSQPVLCQPTLPVP